jgi:uncharacterized membrane protein
MIKNAAKTLYSSHVIYAVTQMDQLVPLFLNKLLYSILFCVGFGIAVGYFVNPIFGMISLIQVFALFWFWTRKKSDKRALKEIESYLRLKQDAALEDVMAGDHTIKAGQMEVYFGIKLNLYWERILLTRIYSVGAHFWLKLRAYCLSVMILVLPYFLIILLTYETGHFTTPKDPEDPEKLKDYRNSLLMVIIIVTMIPDVMDGLITSMDHLYSTICEVDDCLKLTNFDSENKVNNSVTLERTI